MSKIDEEIAELRKAGDEAWANGNKEGGARYHDQASRLAQQRDAEKTQPWNHPAHYGGKDNPFETIKVIEAWGLGFALGNALKYLSRAGKKEGAHRLDDFHKAAWYLRRAAGAGVSPLIRRTTKITPADVAPAWGLPHGLARVVEHLFNGETRRAAETLETIIRIAEAREAATPGKPPEAT